jgi:hypothetical protein
MNRRIGEALLAATATVLGEQSEKGVPLCDVAVP